jgi:hypothetical protein
MLKKLIALFIPIVTVSVGLLIFRSAWLAILGYHSGMALAVVLSKPKISLRILFQSRSFYIPLITTFAGACGGVLLYVLWPYLSVPAGIGAYMKEIGLATPTWPFFLGYYVCVNPFIEEFYWRGFLGSTGGYPGVSDVFFALYHLIVLAGKMGTGWLILVFFVLLGAAWSWRQMNKLAGGLLPSLVSHIAADITVISTIYLLTQR